jgi:hypothetical protein
VLSTDFAQPLREVGGLRRLTTFNALKLTANLFFEAETTAMPMPL